MAARTRHLQDQEAESAIDASYARIAQCMTMRKRVEDKLAEAAIVDQYYGQPETNAVPQRTAEELNTAKVTLGRLRDMRERALPEQVEVLRANSETIKTVLEAMRNRQARSLDHSWLKTIQTIRLACLEFCDQTHASRGAQEPSLLAKHAQQLALRPSDATPLHQLQRVMLDHNKAEWTNAEVYNRLDGLNSTVARLQQAKIDLSDTLKATNTGLEENQALLVAKDELIENLRGEKARVAQNLNDANRELNRKSELLADSVSKASRDSAVQAARESARVNLDKREHELAEAHRKALHEQKESFTSLQSDKENERQQHERGLHDQMASLRAEVAGLQTSVQNLTTQRDRARQDLSHVNALHSQGDKAKNNEIKRLKSTLDERVGDRDNFLDLLQAANVEKSRLQTDLETDRNDLKSAESKLQSLKESHKSEVDGHMQSKPDLEKQVKEVRTRLGESIENNSVLQQQSDTWKARAEESERQITDLKLDIEGYRKSHADCSTKIWRLSTEVSNVRGDHDAATKQAKQETDKLRIAETQVSELKNEIKQQTGQANCTKFDVERLSKDVADLRLAVESKDRELEGKVASLQTLQQQQESLIAAYHPLFCQVFDYAAWEINVGDVVKRMVRLPDADDSCVLDTAGQEMSEGTLDWDLAMLCSNEISSRYPLDSRVFHLLWIHSCHNPTNVAAAAEMIEAAIWVTKQPLYRPTSRQANFLLASMEINLGQLVSIAEESNENTLGGQVEWLLDASFVTCRMVELGIRAIGLREPLTSARLQLSPTQSSRR